jgi:hypothetical protein
MSRIAVFGNGESRKSINLNEFESTVTKIGCNAIHRDFVVDHLVCCDRRMIEEAVENPHNKDTFIYVREEQYHHFRKIRKNKKIQLLPDLPYQGEKRADVPTHWGSGPYAVLVACLLNPSEIDLYGFDLYSKTDYVNNIYKDTKNYKNSKGSAVDPSYWIYQISKLFITFPKINFQVHNEKNWKMPLQWQQANVKMLELSCSYNKYLV